MRPSPDTLWAEAGQMLSDLKVLELSSGIAGAYCGSVLRGLGADVARWPQPTRMVAAEATRGVMQQVLHEGKVALSPHALASKLGEADVVIVDTELAEHPAREVMERLMRGDRQGLRPDAVVLVLSAAGIQDDLAMPGCGLTSAAASGMSFAIGDAGLEPLAPPYDIADYQAGINGVTAALAARLGGLGSCGPVDVASRDVLANLVGTLAQNYVPFGRPWRREGTKPSLSGGVYPCGLFPCKDGYVAIYCRGTTEWHGILRAMGDPLWSVEERFRDPKTVAMEHGDEADRHLLPWLAQFKRAELMEMGDRFGFPASPVRYLREALADEQFTYRGSLRPFAAGDGKPSLQVPVSPWRIRSAPQRALRLPSWARRTSQPPPPERLLEGLRVLDFTWVWSGPMVTSFLADLGAEVIKVEHPSRLDSLRQRARPLRNGVPFEGPPSGELNPWFNQLNHGKKSIIADLKSPADRERLLRLATTCDVVVENMRPGALAAGGLDYDELAQRNPGLVMLSMSMAGQSGPLAQMKGYAGIMTSMAGLESVTGYQSDAVDAPFTGMTMTALGDPNGAAHGIAALLAALHRRVRTGQGAWIDLAQTDAILSILAAPAIECQLLGHVPVRGNAHPMRFPHGHFPCAGQDSWIALSVNTDEQWQALSDLLGLLPLRGLDLHGRQSNGATITDALTAWTSARSADSAVAALRGLAIGCAPVASYEQMMRSAWKAQRGLTRVVEHPYLGPQELFLPPWRFGSASAGVPLSAPLLGQHTEEVLGADALSLLRTSALDAASSEVQ